MGPDARKVYACKNGPNAVVTILYKDGVIVTMNCLKEDTGGFHFRACTPNGILTYQGERGPQRHEATARALHRFLKTGINPVSREEMLAPIAILDAIRKSFDTGRTVNVAKV